MVYEIKNNKAMFAVNSLGAEPSSFKVEGIEYLWQGERHWNRKAPNLFPFCGRMKDNTLLFNGKEYLAERHGFARGMQFELVEQTENSLCFCLKSNDKTLELYPFEFTLYVRYTLIDSKLDYKIIVENPGNCDMYFSVGTHFGVNMCQIPNDNQSNYTLRFPKDDTINNLVLDSAGYLTGEVAKYSAPNGNIAIDGNILAQTLIFNDFASNTVELENKKTGRKVIFGVDNCLPVVIWSNEGEVEYICIEPWAGLPDMNTKLVDFSYKPAIVRLAPHDTFVYKIYIQII